MRKESDDPEWFAFRLLVIIFLVFIAVMACMAYVVFVENGDAMTTQSGIEQLVANFACGPTSISFGAHSLFER